MSQPKEPQVYRVGIYRQDLSEPIYVLDTDNIDEARSKHLDLNVEWVKSVEEKRAFQLIEHMRSFVPALILEIKVDSIPLATYQRMNTPYEQQLREMGTTGFMQRNFQR